MVYNATGTCLVIRGERRGRGTHAEKIQHKERVCTAYWLIGIVPVRYTNILELEFETIFE